MDWHASGAAGKVRREETPAKQASRGPAGIVNIHVVELSSSERRLSLSHFATELLIEIGETYLSHVIGQLDLHEARRELS